MYDIFESTNSKTKADQQRQLKKLIELENKQAEEARNRVEVLAEMERFLKALKVLTQL